MKLYKIIFVRESLSEKSDPDWQETQVKCLQPCGPQALLNSLIAYLSVSIWNQKQEVQVIWQVIKPNKQSSHRETQKSSTIHPLV